jgi:hypothetical protein
VSYNSTQKEKNSSDNLPFIFEDPRDPERKIYVYSLIRPCTEKEWDEQTADSDRLIVGDVNSVPYLGLNAANHGELRNILVSHGITADVERRLSVNLKGKQVYSLSGLGSYSYKTEEFFQSLLKIVPSGRKMLDIKINIGGITKIIGQDTYVKFFPFKDEAEQFYVSQSRLKTVVEVKEIEEKDGMFYITVKDLLFPNELR